MFEVGFTELLLIFVLALLVLGPERLPRVASQVGRWLGRARALARQFREQLEDESQFDLGETKRGRRGRAAEASAPRQEASTRPPDFVPGDDDFAHHDTADDSPREGKTSDERGA